MAEQSPLFAGIVEEPKTDFDSNLFADLENPEMFILKPKQNKDINVGNQLLKEMTPPPDTSFTGRFLNWSYGKWSRHYQKG